MIARHDWRKSMGQVLDWYASYPGENLTHRSQILYVGSRDTVFMQAVLGLCLGLRTSFSQAAAQDVTQHG
jgi:hypothetical protein